MINRILLATDGSIYSEKAGKYAIYLAKTLGAELTMVHVIEQKMPKSLSPEEIKKQKAIKAREVFSNLEEYAKKEELRFSTGILVSRDSAQAILKESEEGFDLVVVGSLGKSGLKKFILGSVSEKVVGEASVPVMVVH